MDNRFAEMMNGGFEQLGLSLTDRQQEQFYQFYEQLVEWNKVMNLTAITEMDAVVSKHFVDSAALVKCGLDLNGQRVIDVGTGAGFPGIPLKILFPEMKITLLDSLNKRIHFLEEVCSRLELDQVELIHGRAEDYGRNKQYRGQFDLAVSRAVANLASLSEYCLPFVKIGGSFISYKSEKVEEEMAAAAGAVAKLGGKLEETCSFALLPENARRNLVRIRKAKETPGKYPRKAGLPAKEPLS